MSCYMHSFGTAMDICPSKNERPASIPTLSNFEFGIDDDPDSTPFLSVLCFHHS